MRVAEVARMDGDGWEVGRLMRVWKCVEKLISIVE